MRMQVRRVDFSEYSVGRVYPFKILWTDEADGYKFFLELEAVH